jgi:hypothetical protein
MEIAGVAGDRGMRFPGVIAVAWLMAVGAPALADPPAGSKQVGLKQAVTAQEVILYEEDAANPEGIQFPGSAVWRVDRAHSAAGRKSGTAIRGGIEVPERKMSVHVSILRNDASVLPASHTIEITFRLPRRFPHISIANVPGILMKENRTARGIALSGVTVKVKDNFFLVGLQAGEADEKRNIGLLKNLSWLDIPVVYGDGRRALIAIEKGAPGERAFAEAFSAWEQEERGSAAPAP